MPLRYQEDFYSYSSLSLDPEELKLSLKKAHHINWDYYSLPESIARQVLFVGIYDGHGGSAVAQFLRQELHGMFENVNKSQVPELYAWTREMDGYFRRFKGGVLAPWVNADAPEAQTEMDLEARATLAFFEVCCRILLERFVFQMLMVSPGGQDLASGIIGARVRSDCVCCPLALD